MAHNRIKYRTTASATRLGSTPLRGQRGPLQSWFVDRRPTATRIAIAAAMRLGPKAPTMLMQTCVDARDQGVYSKNITKETEPP